MAAVKILLQCGPVHFCSLPDTELEMAQGVLIQDSVKCPGFKVLISEVYLSADRMVMKFERVKYVHAESGKDTVSQ